MPESYLDHLDDEATTLAFGAKLALLVPNALVIFLHGDLGAGKTTLCRGLLQALGHVGAVKSPTYTLVEPYSLGSRTVYHFDLYRLCSPEELEFLGIRDYLDQGALLLFEWPERGAGHLPAADLQVHLQHQAGGRSLECRSSSQGGAAIVTALREAVHRAHS